MTSLNAPKLATSKEEWQVYDLHLTGVYVLKEFFLASNYRESIRATENGTSEVGRWAREMRADNYHELFTHSFVGMWAAYEAGVENVIAAFIKNSSSAATSAASIFKPNRYPISTWPWSDEMCSEIAHNLDPRAKDSTPNGGFDLYARYCTLFGWLGVNIDSAFPLALELAEAGLMRNIIMHRYGVISESDSKKVANFEAWRGRVMPLDRETFNRYYLAISGSLSQILFAVHKSAHMTTSKAGS
jgi:hypothetical protein